MPDRQPQIHISKIVGEADAARSPWGAVLLIAPHLVLGSWLLVVPDYLAFRTTQVVTLLHVALAILSLPLIAVWVARHVIRMETRRERKSGRGARWVFLTSAITAMATGGVVAWGGDIVRAHPVHTWVGLAVGVQLAWHVWSAGRRRSAMAIAALLVVAIAGAALSRKLLPPKPIEAEVPAFDYKTRSTSQYAGAAKCGECHAADYADWKRSTHARTMDNPLIRDGFLMQTESVGFDLQSFGKMVKGQAMAHDNAAFISCEMCHSPTSFYGDDTQNPLHAKGNPSEGVTCSFCHTLRAVKTGDHRGEPIAKELLDPMRRRELLPLLPLYVSAPETVRPYLWEGSSNKVAHWVSNLLVRWRPEVHRHDYHSAVLDSSLACMPCHSGGGLDLRPEVPLKTYRSWETSRYNTGSPETTVTCQDCHMVRTLTAEKRLEPARLVPWGPLRQTHSLHSFTGGNRTISDHLHDEEFGLAEHEMNTKTVTVEIIGARRNGEFLEVDVRAKSRLMGHDLPSMGAQNRWLWIEVSAQDAAGNVLGVTSEPSAGDDRSSSSPVMFRCVDHPSPDCDTLLQPDKPRVFTARVKVPREAAPASMTALMHMSVDRDAIAGDSRAFPFVQGGKPPRPFAVPRPAVPIGKSAPPNSSLAKGPPTETATSGLPTSTTTIRLPTPPSGPPTSTAMNGAPALTPAPSTPPASTTPASNLPGGSLPDAGATPDVPPASPPAPAAAKPDATTQIACESMAAELVAGKKLKLDPAPSPHNQNARIEEASFAIVACRALVTDARACDVLAGAAKSYCKLRWAFLLDGKDASRGNETSAAAVFELCTKTTQGVNCGGVRDALKTRDVGQCPKDSDASRALCAAIVSADSTDCPKTPSNDVFGCVKTARWTSLLRLGGINKLAEGGDEMDALLARAIQKGGADACKPAVDYFIHRCVGGADVPLKAVPTPGMPAHRRSAH